MLAVNDFTAKHHTLDVSSSGDSPQTAPLPPSNQHILEVGVTISVPHFAWHWQGKVEMADQQYSVPVMADQQYRATVMAD